MTVRASRSLVVALATTAILSLCFVVSTAGTASAAQSTVGLGTATSYAVLAGSAVTNTGPSVVNGDLGVSPESSVTGFPPGLVNGVIHGADAEALQAKTDLGLAYDDAAGRTPATAVATELGGTTLLPGAYTGATLGLTGTVTLDALGDPGAVFIIKSDSTLITASNSSVSLIGEADPCNVYWQVSSSATLGTGTAFVGTVLAATSITADTGATVQGRLLAGTGAVTLDTNVITRPTCAVTPPIPTTTSTSTTEAPATTVVPGSTSTTTAPTGTTTTGVPGTTTTTAGTPGSTTTVVPEATTTTATPGPSTTVADTATSPPVGGPTIPGSGPTVPGDTSTTAPGLTTGSQDRTTTTTGVGGGSPTPSTWTGLPRTGSQLGRLVAAGVGTLSLGGILVVVTRRRAAASFDDW